VLFSSNDNYYYYLVSGRWFRSKHLSNNVKWGFITEHLPTDFKNIPSNNPRASVRASVPGTIEAETAIIMAQIPHKVQIKKSIVKPKVVYAGKPDFKPIESTKLTYAVNTSSDIIYFKDKYYLCQDGIWFISVDAEGPWFVATKIPVEIYQIPASSPLYHTTFVYVYGSTIDTVTVGYTAGYSNVYVSYGVVVYGSGWYYPPYWYYGPYYPYPIYYPYPYTYGAKTYYNPITGTYGRAGWAYGPYGGAGYGTAYNPTTGTYLRASAAYGPSGAKLWVSASNPRTNTKFASVQGTDYYNSWGASTVTHDDKWTASAHYKNDQASIRGFKTFEGNSTFIAHDENNLYASRNGKIYRRTDDGWQKQQDGNWTDVSRPTDPSFQKPSAEKIKKKYPDASNKIASTRDKSSKTYQRNNINQLNLEYQQRQYGQQRMNQHHSRPSGGFNRGQSGGFSGRRR